MGRLVPSRIDKVALEHPGLGLLVLNRLLEVQQEAARHGGVEGAEAVLARLHRHLGPRLAVGEDDVPVHRQALVVGVGRPQGAVRVELVRRDGQRHVELALRQVELLLHLGVHDLVEAKHAEEVVLGGLFCGQGNTRLVFGSFGGRGEVAWGSIGEVFGDRVGVRIACWRSVLKWLKTKRG